MEATKALKIREQLEYYLSDSNLERDEFFHKKIRETPGGFINLQFIETCNNIKKLGADRAEIVEAARGSDLIELGLKDTSIRRKDNKELPALKPTAKKIKTNSNQITQNNILDELEDLEVVKKQEGFQPILLVITNPGEIKTKGKDAEDLLEQKYGKAIGFVRISKDDGHIVLNKKETSKSDLSDLLANGFKISDDETMKVSVASDYQQKMFYREHLSHIQKILHKKFEEKVDLKQISATQNGPITFMNQKYQNAKSLAAVFKKAINKVRDGDKIPGDILDMLKELIVHHPNYSDKLEGTVDFEVLNHPEYKSTRCFFAVKEDGSKSEFSYHKCIQQLAVQNKRKK